MRQLTLHEKINLKGLFVTKGLVLPRLDMPNALHFWWLANGYFPISRWAVYGVNIKSRRHGR